MTYVKINGVEYPATIMGRGNDKDFDGRASKAITLEMMHATACATFVDGLAWSIVQRDTYLDEEGVEQTQVQEFDNSDYNVAGEITDHRDGTITAKMGRPTEMEIVLAGIMEELSNE